MQMWKRQAAQRKAAPPHGQCSRGMATLLLPQMTFGVLQLPRWLSALQEQANTRRRRNQARIVITDVALKPDDVSRAIRRTAWITGTFTEARRLAEKVRWLDFCLDETIAHITQVASNELALALEDHPDFTRDNILFLVWKEKKVSFGGVAKLDLAWEICHECSRFLTSRRPQSIATVTTMGTRTKKGTAATGGRGAANDPNSAGH